jgi:hypothetical protein
MRRTEQNRNWRHIKLGGIPYSVGTVSDKKKSLATGSLNQVQGGQIPRFPRYVLIINDNNETFPTIMQSTQTHETNVDKCKMDQNWLILCLKILPKTYVKF